MNKLRPKIIRWKILMQILPISRNTFDKWEKKKNFSKSIYLCNNSIKYNFKQIENV